MKAALTHALRFALGWICLCLGVVGLFLPVLPGVVFLLFGFALLFGSEKVKRWTESLMSRWPSERDRLRVFKERLRASLGWGEKLP